MSETSFQRRVARFASKPWPAKFRSFAFRWLRRFPFMPLPLKLPFGSWWMLRGDVISAGLLDGNFENSELRFVQRFLKPGMTVLDIGANQGLYTLLASKLVGTEGRVLAVEPSPREFRRLKFHLWINSCKNVEVVNIALGAVSGSGQLHVVMGSESGCNSMRPPDVAQPTQQLPVSVERLEDVVRMRGIASIDLIKLDVEGAELSVLQGAGQVISSDRRPVILVEAQDLRTKPWGYPAKDILLFLQAMGYSWYSIRDDGSLLQLDVSKEFFDGNFVAWPSDRETTFEDPMVEQN